MTDSINADHYKFDRYMHKRRWISVWHQIDEVLRFSPTNVLEVGPGSGLLKAAISICGIKVEAIDINPELNPDYIGSCTNLPFCGNSYDVVCGFQVLEHMPFEKSVVAFQEMARIAKSAVIISLPDAKKRWPIIFHLPLIGQRSLFIPLPIVWRYLKLNDQHFWEVNIKGYALKNVVKTFENVSKLRLTKTYRVPENPYHRFFVFINPAKKDTISG